jgi:hypothetical protein
MSKVSANSKLALSSDLYPWRVPFTDGSFEDTRDVECRPKSDINSGGGIIFEISTSNEEHIRLNGFWIDYMISIVQADGQPIPNDQPSALINMIGKTIFSSISVELNNKPIHVDNASPYRNYFQTVFSYGVDAKNSHLKTGVYEKDTAGAMNTTGAANRGFEARRLLTANGAAYHIHTRLDGDVFNIRKLLPSKMNMRITLQRKSAPFCIMSNGRPAVAAIVGPPAVDAIPGVEPDYRVVIDDIKLWATVSKLRKEVLLGQLKRLELDNAEYIVPRTEVRSFCIAQGTRDYTHMCAFSGQIPKLILFGLVHNDAFNGSYNRNPFNFEHYNLTNACVYVNGTPMPHVPFTPNYATTKHNREFQFLFDVAGIKTGNRGLDLAPADFPNGYCIYAVDLTSNQGATDASHVNIVKYGEVRIDLKFGAATPNIISCVYYAEFDNKFDIDYDRNVITNWTIGKI